MGFFGSSLMDGFSGFWTGLHWIFYASCGQLVKLLDFEQIYGGFMRFLGRFTAIDDWSNDFLWGYFIQYHIRNCEKGSQPDILGNIVNAPGLVSSN